MSRVATLVRSLLIALLLAQSFAVGAMEARAALASNPPPARTLPPSDDDGRPPCHRVDADAAPRMAGDDAAADCCSQGACRCLGLMLALPQIDPPTLSAEAPAALVAAALQSRLPAPRPDRPLRPPSA